MLIEDLIEEMEEITARSWKVPLTGGKCLVDINDLVRILDDMRLNMPSEIQKAKEIIGKEQKIIEGARSASETIVEKAEERAKDIIDEQEIVKLAKQKAREILMSAQQKEKEIKQSAYEYVEKMMLSLEDSLKKCLIDIKDIKTTFYNKKINDKKLKSQ